MPTTEFQSLEAITLAFPDEESCMRHLEQLRWNGFVSSPFDPLSKVYKCAGDRYRCRNTGKYFNAKTGTLFYNSKIELQKWFMALWLLSNSKSTITSTDLGIALGITQKSAWYLLRRIKKHIGTPNIEKPKRKKIGKLETPIQNATRDEIVVVESEKLQLTEWLQMLKK